VSLTIDYTKQTQLLKSQMNVYPYNTTDYENKSNWTLSENKPNSNPISNPKTVFLLITQEIAKAIHIRASVHKVLFGYNHEHWLRKAVTTDFTDLGRKFHRFIIRVNP